MESILEQICRPEAWEEFLAYRLRKGRFNWHGFEQADDFVADGSYLPVAERYARGEPPSLPTRHLVNKTGAGRKRVVYSLPPDEMAVLKIIAWMLYRYDAQLPPGCYSFRRGLTAHDAVRRVVAAVAGRPMWAYKLDIHDYFNSISIPLLLPILREVLADDPPLYRFFEALLADDRARTPDGALVRGPRGVMAGTPTSPFLADIYLAEVDRHFADAGVVYARYSDDILLFAPDRGALEEHIATLAGFLEKYRLTVNPDKVRVYAPGEPFDFLGFKCLGDQIDIADATRRKMKDRIRRQARSLLRWRIRHGVDAGPAMKALIRYFNRTFFEDEDPEALNWSRWFFPLINRTDGLREIDRYLQQNLRYLATGRHNKANYRVRYAQLKELGYRSLVHEFYAYREERQATGRSTRPCTTGRD